MTHCCQGKEGSTLDRYVRTANDILFNPETTIDTVETAYERRATDEDDDQTDLETQATLAHLERVGDDIREKAAQFDERAATLRERFETADA